MARSSSRRWQSWKRQTAANDRLTQGPKVKRQPAAKLSPFWLVIAGMGSHCTECSKGVSDRIVAYHHPTKQVLCRTCWEARGLHPRESKALREMREAGAA